MAANNKPRYRRTFVKEAVVGFGFLSGIWIHLGFDPSTFVYAFLQKILITADPVHEKWITLGFLVLPVALVLSAVFGAYRRAGLWGLLAVLLAFLAGLFLNALSIPLIIAAAVIGLLAARR